MLILEKIVWFIHEIITIIIITIILIILIIQVLKHPKLQYKKLNLWNQKMEKLIKLKIMIIKTPITSGITINLKRKDKLFIQSKILIIAAQIKFMVIKKFKIFLFFYIKYYHAYKFNKVNNYY